MRDMSGVSVIIHFKDLSTDEALRDHLTERFHHLADEFSETDRYELTLELDASKITAHAHASGKQTDCAAHIVNQETTRLAGDRVIEKLERELRTHHDKRIFSQRRRAQKDQVKRPA